MYLFSHVFARRGTWILLDILTCDQPTTASLAGGDSFCWLVQALYDPGPDSDVSQGKKSIGACISPKLMRFLLLPLPTVLGCAFEKCPHHLLHWMGFASDCGNQFMVRKLVSPFTR